MRTLIDVSLFVHTRRAWHGKQYFTLATIVVAWSVSHSFSFSPPPSSPFPLSLSLSSSHLGPPYRLVSLAFTRLSLHLSLALDTQGPKGGRETSARYLIAVGPSHTTPRHERTNYTSHVSAPLVPARVALVHVYQGGLNWSRSGLSSNKCLAISDIRQPDTSNLYGPRPRAPRTLGKKLFGCFVNGVIVASRLVVFWPGVMVTWLVGVVGSSLGRVIGM